MSASIADASGAGVSADGAGPYVDGFDGVKVYFGAGGKNVVLTTLGSSRRVVISSPIGSWGGETWMSTVGQESVTVESHSWARLDDGGRFVKMAVGSTASASGDIEFPWDGWTYKLRFQDPFPFEVTRTDADTWLMRGVAASVGRFRDGQGLQWFERIDMAIEMTITR